MGILFFRARRYESSKVRTNSWPLWRLCCLQRRRWCMDLLKNNFKPENNLWRLRICEGTLLKKNLKMFGPCADVCNIVFWELDELFLFVIRAQNFNVKIFQNSLRHFLFLKRIQSINFQDIKSGCTRMHDEENFFCRYILFSTHDAGIFSAIRVPT